MLVKSTLLSGMSGKLAGTVFTGGRSGSVARAWAKPSNPNTPAQSTVRQAMSTNSKAYSALTVAQHAAWAAYAGTIVLMNRLGDRIGLTGQNAFVRVNQLLAMAGRSQVTATPPIPGAGAVLEPFTLGTTIAAPAAGATQIVATIGSTASWRSTATSTLVAYISRPQSPARSNPLGGYTYSARVAGNATPPTTFNLPLPGGLALKQGEKVFVRFVAVNANGEASGDFYLHTLVTA